MALIQEDTGYGKEKAIETLRESTQYGVSMFPDLDKDEDGDTVGDKLLQDKLRARIAKGGAQDDDDGFGRNQPEESLVKAKGRSAGRSKKSSRSEPSLFVNDSGIVLDDAETVKGKRKSKAKAKASASDTTSDSDAIIISDSIAGSDASARSPAKRRKKPPMKLPPPKGSAGEHEEAAEMALKTPKAKTRQPSVVELSSGEEETPRPKLVLKSRTVVLPFQARNAVGTRSEGGRSEGSVLQRTLTGDMHPLEVARARKAQSAE